MLNLQSLVLSLYSTALSLNEAPLLFKQTLKTKEISAIGRIAARSDQSHGEMQRKLDSEFSCVPLIIRTYPSDQASSGGEWENPMILIEFCVGWVM